MISVIRGTIALVDDCGTLSKMLLIVDPRARERSASFGTLPYRITRTGARRTRTCKDTHKQRQHAHYKGRFSQQRGILTLLLHQWQLHPLIFIRCTIQWPNTPPLTSLARSLSLTVLIKMERTLNINFWQSAGAFHAGFYFPLRISSDVEAAGEDLLSKSEFVCVLRWDTFHGVREASCHNNAALLSISLAVCTTSLVARITVTHCKWIMSYPCHGVWHAPWNFLHLQHTLRGVLICFYGKFEHTVSLWDPPHVPAYTQTVGQILEDLCLFNIERFYLGGTDNCWRSEPLRSVFPGNMDGKKLLPITGENMLTMGGHSNSSVRS